MTSASHIYELTFQQRTPFVYELTFQQRTPFVTGDDFTSMSRCTTPAVYVDYFRICKNKNSFFISCLDKRPPWREILKHPPSVCLCLSVCVCLSVKFNFRTNSKRIAVFSWNFAGACTMSCGCAVDIVFTLMGSCLNYWWIVDILRK